MNPPKHRGSRCYIAMEKLANPTKTNTVQRLRGKEKSSATDLVMVMMMVKLTSGDYDGDGCVAAAVDFRCW